MKNKDLFRLRHIRDSIEKIEHIARILHTQDNFVAKWIEQDAIIRNLEIIGEAVINISDDLKQQYPNVSWKEIRGMRNIVSHQYFGVELNEVWNTVVNDIPFLKNQIHKIIEDIENPCTT
jgi:uncharacterized protein with HEPN domain